MSTFEYKVIPAPATGLKTEGLETPEAHFAYAVQTALNDLAADGWEFQRAECLPSTERSGLTARTTRNRHMLVFRRTTAVSQPAAVPTEIPSQPSSTPQTPDEDASQSRGETQMLRDNGVEELSDVAGLTSSLKTLASARKHSETDS
ncbi:MAG: DUF4177 domain-containing protein [Roseobacter sp.]